MSRRAMAFVCSGVRACFVSATRRPSIRARNTSPALMWRSDAPRSTAALMIFSMRMDCPDSVARVLVDEVPERIPAPVSHPVVEEQLELAFPEPPRAYCCHVRGEEHLRHAPEWAGCRQWFLSENVEHSATESPVFEPLNER